ncbi:MAG TPA: hypothetical protein VEL79_03445 [Vicinamibacterales bacterium]|nr:hypothetical protein [Vicinamibacterales bacterium]
MADWKNEDDIKAELRVLTNELKHLREELRDMVSPPRHRAPRAFLHRQSWPPSPTEPADKPPVAADRRRKPRKRR